MKITSNLNSDKQQETADVLIGLGHMNKKHWISVGFNGKVPDALIKELVKKSYELVIATLPKKETLELEKEAGDAT